MQALLSKKQERGVLKLADVFFLNIVARLIELVLLKRYLRPVLLNDAPGG
jgi:hypothetical protein